MKTICSNCEAENEASSKYCSVCGYSLPEVEKQPKVLKTESSPIVKSKKGITGKSVVTFILFFIGAYFGTQYVMKSSMSIDKELAATAKEINKKCPMQVDEYTTLKNVVSLPNKTIQYNYSLFKMIKEEVKLDTVKKYVFPGILERVKTAESMKSFRENEVTVKYNYTDKNGVFVTEYVITPEMYK